MRLKQLDTDKIWQSNECVSSSLPPRHPNAIKLHTVGYKMIQCKQPTFPLMPQSISTFYVISYYSWSKSISYTDRCCVTLTICDRAVKWNFWSGSAIVRYVLVPPPGSVSVTFITFIPLAPASAINIMLSSDDPNMAQNAAVRGMQNCTKRRRNCMNDSNERAMENLGEDDN